MILFSNYFDVLEMIFSYLKKYSQMAALQYNILRHYTDLHSQQQDCYTLLDSFEERLHYLFKGWPYIALL